MATSDIYTNIYPKKLMDQEALADHFLEYMRKLIQDSQSTIYATSGFFSPVTLAADTIDTFDVTAFRGQDDVSNILELGASNNVPFENVNTILYYVAVGYASTPNEAEINPRTSLPEYKSIRDEVGDVADPDSAADGGGSTIVLVVDSVTEAGVSNAGRTVRVWLKNPVSAVSWFEDCIVAWDGSNNKITTVGPLGQATISTTASDYSVWRKGVTVKRNTDLSGVPAYAYIGTVTGAGSGVTPTVFSTTGQKLLASDPNVALNLATVFKDVYKTPTFPDDGNPKFTDPIEYWWEQEHNNSDYTHDDVTFQTLVAKLQTGLQFTIQAFDVADNSNIKAVFKNNAGANASWIYGSGKFNIIDLQTRDTTILGTASTDDLSILASIIADVAMDSGGANSPAIKYYASGSLTRPFVMFNQAGTLIIGRNDAIVTDAIVKFWNVASATDKVNIEVQGTITGYGNVILDSGAVATSPLLRFLANTAGEDWDVSVNGGIMTVNRSTAGTAKLKIVSTTTSYLEADQANLSQVNNPVAALNFDDVNTTSIVPLSSGSDVALATTSQNLIGAINEAFALAGTLPPHNHDDRYYTKTEMGSTISTFGSALIGHGNDDMGNPWEAISVKAVLDALGRMSTVMGKEALGFYYNSSITHITIPPQTINCKGKIRWRDTSLNLSWTDLDGGVSQLARHAYYVYLKPDTSPATTYTGVITDIAPSFGYHPGSGKEDWVYIGAFVSQLDTNVMPFKRVGDMVVVETSDTNKLMLVFGSLQTDYHAFLTDGNVGVVPETAKLALIADEYSFSTGAGNSAQVWSYASSRTPAATYYSYMNHGRSGVTNQNREGAGAGNGFVGLGAGRDFYYSNVRTGNPLTTFGGNLYRMGWVEDIHYGKLV